VSEINPINKRIFEPAIDLIEEFKIKYYDGGSFQKYIENNNLGNAKTAEKISVDSFEKLDPQLREKNIMVFRLGKANNGPGTAFALRKMDDMHDFFLVDEKVFIEDLIDFYIPDEQLLPYKIIRNLTEQSYLNIAINSGILSKALSVDGNIYSANTQSNYTFDFKLMSDDEIIVSHINGQVEIDSVFATKRNGEKVVIIIEAKSDNIHKSLSKHKLVYPILAIANSIPEEYKIVPVYLKITKDERYIYFKVAECDLPDPRNRVIGINELVVKKSMMFRVAF